jgi:ankyrin repeat protein
MKRAQLNTFISAWRSLMTGYEEGFSPLTLAVKEGYVEAVKDMVGLGADVNGKDRSGFSPLMRAVSARDVDMIGALGAQGADVNTPFKCGRTPMDIALQEGHVDVIRALAGAGASVNTPDNRGVTPVCIAVMKGRVDVIRALAEHGADVNTPDEDGWTPVYRAADEGHVDVIRALVEHGADVNTPDKEGWTPVCAAALNDHVDVIRALVEHGADVNTPNQDGWTPAYGAAIEGHVDVIKELIKLRADIDLANSEGKSPLMMAVRIRHRDAAVCLVKSGADVKQCLDELEPANTEHIRDMMTQLDLRVGSPSSCSLFSLTKLLSSVVFPDDSTASHDECQLLETSVALSLRHLLLNEAIEHMQKATSYVLKRRLVRVAYRVYQSTLLLDGDRVSAAAKARRYVELVCFLFDLDMLGDVLALRMTCKSNNERRRFPVWSGASNGELEANIVEEWLGYGSCHFVPTDVIRAVMVAMHRQGE